MKFRHPKTTQERRVNGKRNLLFVDDYTIKLRAKRNYSRLPSNRDDIWFKSSRNWKRHRRTQYKS